MANELNRRSFLKGAGMTALAGAAGAGTITATAADGPMPYMKNGKFDFDTPYSRIGTDSVKFDSQITKLSPMRAYCVALSAAITVIVANWLGLPVSSTHIPLGGVFGVGFFREWDAERCLRKARLAVPDRTVYGPEERRR